MLLDHTPQMILSQFKDFGPFFALEAEVERVCVRAHGHARKHALAS